MATFGGNVRGLRMRLGLKAKDLAARLGVRPSVVSGWEHDRGGLPETPTLLRLAKALRVSVDALLDGVDREYDQVRRQAVHPGSNVEPYDRDIGRLYRPGEVPVVGDAEASTNGIIAWDPEGVVRGDVEHWVSRSFADGDPKAYALRVRNDSMVPRYYPGEIVIAQPRVPVHDGDFACVQLKSGERLVKRVFKTKDGWLLRSMNDLYPERTVRRDEVMAIHRIKHNISP